MINEKRKDLQQFIEEQIHGPGICGYRYVNPMQSRWEELKCEELNPINYEQEIVDAPPAVLYSTGLLFPEKQITVETDDSDSEDEEGTGLGKNSQSSIDEEESVRVNQQYPTTMGFTFRLNRENLGDRQPEIKVTARYYTKIEELWTATGVPRFAILCECDSKQLQNFIEENNLDDFQLLEKGPNTFLTVRKSAEYENILNTLFSGEDAVIKKIGRTYYKSYVEAGESYAFISGAKPNTNINGLRQAIFYQLSKVDTAEERKELYEEAIELERIDGYFKHFRSLLDILNSRNYGLWKAVEIEELVALPEPIKEKFRRKIYSFKDYESLKNIFSYSFEDGGTASLSLNIQLSTDSRNKADNSVFLKAQLVNTSTPYKKEEDDNRYYSAFNEEVNKRCFAGVKLSIQDEALISYNSFSCEDYTAETLDEDAATKFIYRHYEDYAVGHGCSVRWEKKEEGAEVSTTYLPFCDTPDVDPTPKDKEEEGFPDFFKDTKGMQFKWLSTLSEASDDEVSNALLGFVDTYQTWIDKKQRKYEQGDEACAELAEKQLEGCQKDCTRMRKNVQELLGDTTEENNMWVFRLMNTAMFMQIWHSKRRGERLQNRMNSDDFGGFTLDFYKTADDKLFGDFPAAWRAFQLAFILLNLDGIFKPLSDDEWKSRNEWVDLVWFPTGGGKTEAYLGLATLTIFNRRVKHKEKGGGTAVLMRYTLRLLTLQQFQRATLVVMAMELLRRLNPELLGEEPIRIGSWVGSSSLPNKRADLQEELQKLTNGSPSMIPLDTCPWCASKLIYNEAGQLSGGGIFFEKIEPLCCSNGNCSFGITQDLLSDNCDITRCVPVLLCDEDIYLHPPAFLLGTVDKFASLAHKTSNEKGGREKDSRRLFGRGNWEKGRPKEGYLPPDLIIQDELHLLLGPLGSSVALFETAINHLSKRKDGTRAKVISSTATTRNTDLQIRALFDRKVNLFPKPGVECDDSFFAFYKRENTGKYISKRRYLGILPTGRTQIWMQMRLIAIMMTHRALFEIKHLEEDALPFDSSSYSKELKKAMNYYHTIVSYFGSLRAVGKTESQVQSYIKKEVRRVFYRRLRPKFLLDAFYTYNDIVKSELTGRLSGQEVKENLARVERDWKPDERLIGDRLGKKVPEFIVATNMISVGVDVSRWNSIIMNSMPRNIAEYIQASSRVARDAQGLVLTLHHPFRARDISHYEKFVEFHEKMYSYVEPISITPFTNKAIERYLTLFIATILRHTSSRFHNRKDAGKIEVDNVEQMTQDLLTFFQNRKERLEQTDIPDLLRNLIREADLQHIEKYVRKAINDWQQSADTAKGKGGSLVFDNAKSSAKQEALFIGVNEYVVAEEHNNTPLWRVPLSLRVIEPEAAIKIYQK